MDGIYFVKIIHQIIKFNFNPDGTKLLESIQSLRGGVWLAVWVGGREWYILLRILGAIIL